MFLPEIKISPTVIGTKLLLMAASPFQKLFDRPGITHEFCNQQALVIMHNDGFNQSVKFINRYRTELNAGVYWADKGWKNASHYFEPTTGKGLWRFANAFADFQAYYCQAASNMEKKNFERAAFFLGAAVHLVQDLCVPHHARAKLFSGHKEYESWAQQHCLQYSAKDGGVYKEVGNLGSILFSNAVAAADLFDWVNLDQGAVRYHEATEILLPLAQRSTAGVFQSFCANFTAIINNHKWNVEEEPASKVTLGDGDWRVAFELGNY